MSFTSHLRRAGSVIAGVAALAVVTAGPASAHHCLKEWNDAARAQVSSGTAWMAMSDFIAFAVSEEFGMPDACVAHADEWTTAWMAANGVATEPTIHMKATAGGGAQHKKGKEPGPFFYLHDADFNYLVELIFSEPDCA